MVSRRTVASVDRHWGANTNHTSSDPDSGPDYTATGIRGDATLASKEKGKVIVAAIVKDIVTGIRAWYPDALARSE